MTQILAYALALALLAAGGLGFVAYTQHKTVKMARERVATLESSLQAVETSRKAERRAQDRAIMRRDRALVQSKARMDALEAALAASAAQWSAQEVPKEVRDALK